VGGQALNVMDLSRAIRDLYAEKGKIERVIADLEALAQAGTSSPARPASGKPRGRKSMDEKERAEVSERMKKYWASRRKDPEKPPPETFARAARK
jgi:hypothetical protein